MYFDSRIKGKRGLPWFDARTKWQKDSDEYFEQLDDLAQQLDDVDVGPGFYTSLSPEDFDSGYEYVYQRIKELQKYIEQNESTDALDSAICYEARESLQETYDDLLDLYGSAILYDDYCGPDPEDPEDDDWNDDDDDWDDDDRDNDDDW